MLEENAKELSLYEVITIFKDLLLTAQNPLAIAIANKLGYALAISENSNH